MQVSKRITYYREKKGITVNKLANLAGVSQSFLREIELGRKNPTVETLSVLCDALGISLKDFFDDGAPSPMSDDRLQQVIFRLTSEQREKLATFLDTMF